MITKFIDRIMYERRISYYLIIIIKEHRFDGNPKSKSAHIKNCVIIEKKRG